MLSSNFYYFPQTFFKKLHFEMITDSQGIAKIQRGPVYPSPSFPSKVAIVQDQNQKIDTGAIQSLFRFLQFYMHLFLCVCHVYSSVQFDHVCICVTTIAIKIQETVSLTINPRLPFALLYNFPEPLVTTDQFSSFLILLLRIVYKWSHAACDLQRLACFTQHNACEIIQVVVCVKQSVPFIAEFCSMVWMHHSLTVCLVEGHLGCLQFWVITNKAAVNICVQVFCADLSFRFTGINVQEYSSWIRTF